MTARKPLVLNAGLIQQLQAGDVLDANVNEVNIVAASNEESSDAITLGMVVYVSSTGKVKKARSDAAASSRGFAMGYQASVAAGDSGYWQVGGQMEMADWTSVAGAATLTAGAYYYLDPTTAGLITATAPSTVGQYIVCIGQALSTTTFDINPMRPVLL